MKHAIIVGHPNPSSFTLAMANTYSACLTAPGHATIVRDLYRLNFDPCLKLSEMPTRPDWGPAPDVQVERELMNDVNAFAFVYPLWFNSPPAIIKGYIDRVFGVVQVGANLGNDMDRIGGSPAEIARMQVAVGGGDDDFLFHQAAQPDRDGGRSGVPHIGVANQSQIGLQLFERSGLGDSRVMQVHGSGSSSDRMAQSVSIRLSAQLRGDEDTVGNVYQVGDPADQILFMVMQDLIGIGHSPQLLDQPLLLLPGKQPIDLRRELIGDRHLGQEGAGLEQLLVQVQHRLLQVTYQVARPDNTVPITAVLVIIIVI